MKESKIKKIFRSEFVRNSFVLLSGNASGQIIALAAMPLLSRMYSKDDFGILALFLSLSGLLTIIGTGKYEEAFIMTSGKKESASLLNFSLRALTLFCLLIFGILWLFGAPYLSFVKMDALIEYRHWIPLYSFFWGLFILLTYAANREKKYKTIASANLSSNILTSAFKIGLKFITTGAIGLISGQIIGQFFSCFSFYKLKHLFKETLHIKWHEAKTTGLKFSDFPKYTMPQNFINSFSANLPFFLLTGIFGEATLGLFFMAFNISFRPINLISNSLYQVLFENTARLKDEKLKISSKINAFQKYCLIFILPLFIVIYISAGPLFKYIFGADWEESGTYLQYILPWMFMVLLTSPMAFIPLLFKKQKMHMILQTAYFLFRYGGLSIGIYYHDFNLAIILFGAVGFLFLLITQIWYRSLIIKYEKNGDASKNIYS